MFLIFFIFLNTKYKNIKRSYEPLKAIIQFLRLFFALIYWLLKKLFIVEKLIVIIRSSNDVCHNIVDVSRHNAIHNILHIFIIKLIIDIAKKPDIAGLNIFFKFLWFFKLWFMFSFSFFFYRLILQQFKLLCLNLYTFFNIKVYFLH